MELRGRVGGNPAWGEESRGIAKASRAPSPNPSLPKGLALVRSKTMYYIIINDPFHDSPLESRA